MPSETDLRKSKAWKEELSCRGRNKIVSHIPTDRVSDTDAEVTCCNIFMYMEHFTCTRQVFGKDEAISTQKTRIHCMAYCQVANQTILG
jgi:hypothetical protein